MTILILVISALAGYAIGSIPFGYLAGRLQGVDIRQQGSGNIGATNVGRLLGRRWGVFVLVLDALKGFVPVCGLAALTQWWLGAATSFPWYAQLPQRAALVGLATVAGHLWPFTLGFRGGKGVATGLGVALALTVLFPKLVGIPMALAVVVWLAVALTTHYVSLASMLAALTFGLCYFAICYFVRSSSPFDPAQIGLSVIAVAFPLLVILRHHANIGRLLRGEENKWGQRKPSSRV
jgi:glycerol-3-phosphate acyltransferase PlsY